METEVISAIQKGYFQQVRLLVKSGLNVNSRDSYHRTALIYCALVDDESWGVGLARTLLEAGATVYLVDRAGLGPLHYACILRKASLLSVYLGAADFDVNLADHLGNTALHYAAATGFVEAVETLLATCARYGYRIDALNRKGHSPLDMAMRNGHGQCAALIQDERRKLQERRILMRAVSVPEMALLSSDRKWDFSVRRLHTLPNGSEIGNGESVTSGACSSGFKSTFATYPDTPRNSDTSGSTSSTSVGSRPTSARAPNSGVTVRKSWSDNVKDDGSATRRSYETVVGLRGERSTAIRGYEMIIRKLRSLRPICAAPAKDPRSNPAMILGQSPSDLFASSESRQLVLTPSSTTGSWRSAMNGLYDAYYFQFSTTYRSPVKIEASTAADDRGFPNEGVPDGGDARRRPQRKTSALRRTSVGRFAGNGDLQPRNRKSSGIFLPRPQRRQSQQTSVSGSSGDRLLVPLEHYL